MNNLCLKTKQPQINPRIYLSQFNCVHYVNNTEPKSRIYKSNKMNSSNTLCASTPLSLSQGKKTWAQIASTPYIEPVKKETDVFEQALIQKAIQKKQKIEKAKAARSKYLLQRQKEHEERQKEHEERQKEKESANTESGIATFTPGRSDRCEVPSSHQITKRESPKEHAQKMTPTQTRKWAREQVKKHKAEEEARCFEEITRIANLSDDERESHIQYLFAAK